MSNEAGSDNDKWTYLEVIDRASGESEKIRLTDGNADASVAKVAEFLGVSLQDAWAALRRGEQLATFGFVRRLI